VGDFRLSGPRVATTQVKFDVEKSIVELVRPAIDDHKHPMHRACALRDSYDVFGLLSSLQVIL